MRSVLRAVPVRRDDNIQALAHITSTQFLHLKASYHHSSKQCPLPAKSDSEVDVRQRSGRDHQKLLGTSKNLTLDTSSEVKAYQEVEAIAAAMRL